VNEFLLVREAGFRPLGLVLGSSIYHVGLPVGRWSKNQELDTLSQAMYHARELAMTRMEAEADQLGADGIVGVRLEIEFKEFGTDLAEFIAVGTAVKPTTAARPGGTWRNNRNQPFTSDLSGQDFWTLMQAGYAPLGMVMGTCVYHIAHQRSGRRWATSGRTSSCRSTPRPLRRPRAGDEPDAGEAEAAARRGHRRVQLLSHGHRWGGTPPSSSRSARRVRPLRADHHIPPRSSCCRSRTLSGQMTLETGRTASGLGPMFDVHLPRRRRCAPTGRRPPPTPGC
jgi:uncharacterized protein YbjQ (UPF0145 family)